MTTTLPRERLHATFDVLRERQSAHHGRPLSAINVAGGELVFETAYAAATDTLAFIREGERPALTMRVLSLETGVAKTTASVAFAAAGRQVNPEHFSAAFIVPTIEAGRELVAELDALLPQGERTAFWTTAESNVNKELLPDYPVIVVTHALWKRDMEGGRAYSTQHRGEPRTVTFVDELPDLVHHIVTTLDDVRTLEDIASQADERPHWIEALERIIGRMAATRDTNGQRYEVANAIVRPEEAALFRDASMEHLRALLPGWTRLAVVESTAEKLADLFKFIVAAGAGGCFYSRLDRNFVAYEFQYEPGPGHVLLDATADISGLVQLRSDTSITTIPSVSYANLEAVIVEIPRKWRKVRDLLTKAGRAEALAFGKWVEGELLANTAHGDDVLAYSKLELFRQCVLPSAPEWDAPLDFHGRSLNTSHYGVGVGTNRWRRKNVVALIGDHYLKRDVTITLAHGWSGTPLTDAGLRQAEGRRAYGDEFLPRGPYLGIHEGHILRWAKQGAMRGAGRDIASDGTCGRMKVIVFTGDVVRMMRNWSRLFPGSPTPKLGSAKAPTPTKAKDAKPTKEVGLPALGRYLASTDRMEIAGAEIERRFKVPSRNLGVALTSPSVFPLIAGGAWRVVKATTIGKPGQGNWLTRTQLGAH